MALRFRRGSDGQKSGSLQFGEPYVNTDLNTLQIGGLGGDITLSAVGTGSNLLINDITASNMKLTGNANIAGDLTLGGNITIGNATSDVINVVASLSSSLIPEVNNTFNLGSPTKAWKELYVSTGSINFVDGEVKKNYNGSEISLKELKPSGIKKLKTRRFLYLVDSKTFIPHENGNNFRFFSQLPVKILAKEKIVPHAVGAIQDLYKLIVDLQNRVEKLEASVK